MICNVFMLLQASPADSGVSQEADRASRASSGSGNASNIPGGNGDDSVDEVWPTFTKTTMTEDVEPAKVSQVAGGMRRDPRKSCCSNWANLASQMDIV